MDDDLELAPAPAPAPAPAAPAGPVAIALLEVAEAMRIHAAGNDIAVRGAFSAMAARLEARAKVLGG